MKTLPVLFSLVCCLAALIFWTIKKPNNINQNTLKVGMMDGWAPFMVVNKNGDFEGFDVDIAQAVATKLGKKLEIINFGSLAPLFIALEQNKIDMIFSGLDITEKRQKELNMVRYTGENVTSWRLVFWEKIPTGIQTIADINNYPDAVICVEAGSSQEKYLDSLSNITKKNLASVNEMVMDIKFGKSLAFLVEPGIAQQYQNKIPELKQLSVPLPDKFQVFGCGIALKKEANKLTQQVTDCIKALKAEGALKAFEKKWNLEVA